MEEYGPVRLERIGIRLFGKSGWKARLADALGLSRQHMGAMAAETRRVTPDVEARLAAWLRDHELPRLRELELELKNDLADISLKLGWTVDSWVDYEEGY